MSVVLVKGLRSETEKGFFFEGPGNKKGFSRVGGNEAVALIEKTELLRRLQVQLLLQVLTGAAAQLVKDVVIALALRLETAGRQRWNAGDTARA